MKISYKRYTFRKYRIEAFSQYNHIMQQDSKSHDNVH